MIFVSRVGLVAGLAVICTFAATTASAADSGFEIGIGLGASRFHTELDFGSSAVETGRNEDRQDFTWEVAAGYRFNQYFAAKLSYLDLGRSETTLHGEAMGAPVLVEAFVDTTAQALALVGTWPLGKWDLSLELGAVLLHHDATIDASGALGASRKSDSDSGAEFLHGISVGYRFDDHWAGKLTLMEYTNTQGYLSISFVYRF